MLCSGFESLGQIAFRTDEYRQKVIPDDQFSVMIISKASVQFSPVTHLCLSLRPHGLQHTKLPCPSPTPRACSNSCPSSRWCHPTISSSVVPFSSCLQSFPASGSFPKVFGLQPLSYFGSPCIIISFFSKANHIWNSCIRNKISD